MQHRICISLIFYSIILASSAQTQYVSVTGNDAAAGSLAAPWRHIQYGMDNIQPGQTLVILPGTYNEALQLNISGTANAGVNITGVSEDSVFVDGTGLNADNLLWIDSESYAIFKHIHFENNVHNYAAGILIQNTANHIIIDSCIVSEINYSNNSADTANDTTNVNPVVVFGDNVVSTNNIVITHCQVYNCRTGYSEGVSFDGNVDTFEISYNTVHDISNIGIDMEGHYGVCPDSAEDHAQNGNCEGNLVYNCLSPYAANAGIYVDGAYNCVLQRNKVYNCEWGIEVGCETVGATASNIIVRNNFLWNNQLAGIAFGGYDYPTGSGKITACGFYNNSTYNNDTYRQGNGELAITYAENCLVQNNIFYCSNEGQFMYSQSGSAQHLTFDYNCWFTLADNGTQNITFGGNTYTSFAAYQSATSQDPHSILVNPQFLNADTTAADLHITAGSPCLNIGNAGLGAVLGSIDIDSNLRFYLGKVDMGAQEYSDVAGVSKVGNSNITIEIYPNPADDFVVVRMVDWNGQNLVFRLSDILGRGMMNAPLTGADTRLKLASLSSGVYLWTVVGWDEIVSTGRLVVK